MEQAEADAGDNHGEKRGWEAPQGPVGQSRYDNNKPIRVARLGKNHMLSEPEREVKHHANHGGRDGGECAGQARLASQLLDKRCPE